MKVKIESLKEFAKLLRDLQRSDREIVIGTGGFKGEGKSTFDIQLMKEFEALEGRQFDFSRITWSRRELLTWIDGEEGSEVNEVTKLKKGQLPEYSGIIVDELFLLFYRRKWFETGQIEGIATFNMHRDRHLLIMGNTPNFWDLDPGFQKQVRFYVYITSRGEAYVFEQENNAFTDDVWNCSENKKVWRKRGPENCPNFFCKFYFDDLEEDEKKRYLEIRNNKRLTAIQESREGEEKREPKYKIQRDVLIRWVYHRGFANAPQIAEVVKLTDGGVRDILASPEVSLFKKKGNKDKELIINTSIGKPIKGAENPPL